ncbi:hypothetical protein HYPSUDRAFT_325670 [Hypholoma sublateritium FD-334 SS-4]|uniref:AIG1-type G domain-containing protein n=1 Tax=Hypholoma sublateritium (strain FD-334 SS-4) TaxID=945553 RepID=A0A0D2KN49_HYPSF|nr:hypothetical protein HYPSUDRAFT_325670 [Hypholoma sublateritium FD-334 SS-4]
MEDVVIAVMGATGSGKSSFINLLTGKTSVAIGDSLESETADVEPIRFIESVTGRRVTVVDTPGFDDSRQGVTDTDILTKIAKFLLSEYDADRKLTGLVYVQRISDARFSGQQGKTLRMFQKLCGADTFKNVVVLTTFWDEVAPAVGEKREEELRSKFFKGVVDGGARFMRHDRTAASAGAVLSYVFAELAPVVTQIQTELGVERKTLVDTAAGAVQQEEIERVISQHKEEVSHLLAQMETIKESNAAARRALEEKRAQLQTQLAQCEAERAALKEGLQAELARREAERISLQECMDWETRARQKLEADLAVERANQERLRQEQERLLEAQAEANAALAEENRRREENLREEARLREQEWLREQELERIREQERQKRDSVEKRVEKEIRRTVRKIRLW